MELEVLTERCIPVVAQPPRKEAVANRQMVRKTRE
jgi:hypothetical protein